WMRRLALAVFHFVHRRHTQDFLDGRDAFLHETAAVFRERLHARATSRLANGVSRAVLQNQRADFRAGIHPLENRAPTVITGLATLTATNGAIDLRVGLDAEFEFVGACFRCGVELLAMRTQQTHETLREDSFE